jgi:hypothetical protein
MFTCEETPLASLQYEPLLDFCGGLEQRRYALSIS